MKEAYIVDGIRTPIGNFTGTLSTVRADDLGALVIKEIAKRNPNIPLEAYEDKSYLVSFGICEAHLRLPFWKISDAFQA